ncbi:MAG: hypothetical protein FJX60_12545 [Alphaproteobacteria bacterium]|nr:hypothetical protein [Alphaproteobacteria bacterium]
MAAPILGLKLKKKKTPEDQAREIVERLREAIENPDKEKLEIGQSGMYLSDWQKLARDEIASAIRQTQMTTSIKESMKASRIAKQMVRAGFMLLSATFAFLSFWGGIVFVGQSFGLLWGGLAGVSAAGLAVTFMVLGMTLKDHDA